MNLDRLFNLSDSVFLALHVPCSRWWESNETMCVKHLPTVPSRYSVFNKCSFSASLYIHREAAHWAHETWTPNLYQPLPNPPPSVQGCSRMQLRTCLCETHQSVPPGLTTLSISEHAHFLINFFLSGFTFISPNSYSLSSRREFMFTSNIHLLTSPVTSRQDKELIF